MMLWLHDKYRLGLYEVPAFIAVCLVWPITIPLLIVREHRARRNLKRAQVEARIINHLNKGERHDW